MVQRAYEKLLSFLRFIASAQNPIKNIFHLEMYWIELFTIGYHTEGF